MASFHPSADALPLASAAGKHISVGTASATVQIWDASRGKQIRALKGHAARVSALAWNKNTLSSGGRDSVVINHDVRCACCDRIYDAPQPKASL